MPSRTQTAGHDRDTALLRSQQKTNGLRAHTRARGTHTPIILLVVHACKQHSHFRHVRLLYTTLLAREQSAASNKTKKESGTVAPDHITPILLEFILVLPSDDADAPRSKTKTQQLAEDIARYEL